jgi:lysophospholipase L1-like esterase
MTVVSAKRRVVLLIFASVAGILLVLLGILLAVSESTRKGSPYSLRKFYLVPRNEKDAITPVAKDPDRHAEFLERSKQGNIDVVFLGDSITNYWASVGEESWRKFLPYKPVNFGIDGDCTEHLLWRVEHGELDAISPKVVVLLIGSNNVFYYDDETPEWTARGIEKIVTVIQKRAPAAKVLLFGIFPRDEKGSRVRQTITAVNREIQHLDDGVDVRFVDISSQFLDGDGNIPADIMPDQVHLSAKGYDVWYGSLEPILTEMMK